MHSSPAYNEKTFNIESKKIVTVDGVRHEIDIFVRVDVGGGYEAVFIFECKNWAEKVGKNELIIFTEKIQATMAQKGFFVARSFTSDAEAQAAKEPRITLLRLADLPTDQIPIPFSFHGISAELKHIDVQVVANPNVKKPAMSLDLDKVAFSLDHTEVDFTAYAREWGEEESARAVNRFRSHAVEEGAHELSFEAKRDLSHSSAIVNGTRVLEATLKGTSVVHVAHGKIISYFAVESRGRALSVLIDLPSKAKIIATFPTVSANDTSDRPASGS